MEERKELSEILLGNSKQSSSGKKAVFVVIAAIVIIVVVAFLVWKFLITKEEPLAQPSEIVDTSAMKPADDLFSSNFGTLDFGQDTNSNVPGSVDTYGMPSMPQDLNLGFEQEPINAPDDKANSTDIDSALDNIEGAITQAPKAAPKVESSPKPQASKPVEKPKQEAPVKKAPEAPKPAAKPVAETPKVESSPKSPKPAASSTPAQSNGSAPTQGFYWQVGAFEKEPNAEFLTLIKKYSYRIQHIVLDNKPNTRYLLGPYKSRAQAPSRGEIAKIFKENPTPVEVP